MVVEVDFDDGVGGGCDSRHSVAVRGQFRGLSFSGPLSTGFSRFGSLTGGVLGF